MILYMFAQLAGAAEYTDWISAEEKTPPTSALDTEQSFPGPLWPEGVAPDRVLSMRQIELNCVLMLNWIVWNWTVYMYKNGFDIK